MRNRQFSRNNHRNKKTGRDWHWYRVAAVFGGMAIIAGVVWSVGVNHSKDAQSDKSSWQAFSARVDTWWKERKARMAGNPSAGEDCKGESCKQVATVKSKAKPIAPESLHFEFYTMLPNIEASTTTESAPIFNHNALEKGFAESITKTTYVIHSGIYSNAALADKTRQVLAEDGLDPKVVKAYVGERVAYRVQVGPYEEKGQVVAAQSKLAARGIHGTVRKSGDKLA